MDVLLAAKSRGTKGKFSLAGFCRLCLFRQERRDEEWSAAKERLACVAAEQFGGFGEDAGGTMDAERAVGGAEGGGGGDETAPRFRC